MTMTESLITKPQPPVLKNWRNQIEKQIREGAHEKQDLLNVIWLCHDIVTEMNSPSRWLSEQGNYVTGIRNEYMQTYYTRFGEQPPQQPQKEPSTEIILNTAEGRKQIVREISLSLAKPGETISDEAILNEMGKRNMRLDAHNPTATIATILNGYTDEFEKIKEKRGIFKRLIKEQNNKASV